MRRNVYSVARRVNRLNAPDFVPAETRGVTLRRVCPDIFSTKGDSKGPESRGWKGRREDSLRNEILRGRTATFLSENIPAKGPLDPSRATERRS